MYEKAIKRVGELVTSGNMTMGLAIYTAAKESGVNSSTLARELRRHSHAKAAAKKSARLYRETVRY